MAHAETIQSREPNTEPSLFARSALLNSILGIASFCPYAVSLDHSLLLYLEVSNNVLNYSITGKILKFTPSHTWYIL